MPSTLKPYRQEFSKDIHTLRAGQENKEMFRQLRASPILQGVLLKDVSVTTSGTEIPHTLGRRWNGWIVVDKTTTASVTRSDSTDETKFLKLTSSSGTITISLWVF